GFDDVGIGIDDREMVLHMFLLPVNIIQLTRASTSIFSVPPRQVGPLADIKRAWFEAYRPICTNWGGNLFKHLGPLGVTTKLSARNKPRVSCLSMMCICKVNIIPALYTNLPCSS